MHLLFIHPNFPGQFRHLAARLAGDPRHTVVGLGEKRAVARIAGAFPGLKTVGYELPRTAHASTHPYLQGMEEHVLRGQSVVRACLTLKQQGFNPALIVAHAGWGEALYLRDVFPQAKIVGYCEFFYHAEGADVGFDPEFPADFDRRFLLRTRNATQLVTWTGMDVGWSPTAWQRSLYPAELQSRIEVIHEGVDTAIVRPDPAARWTLPDGRALTRDDEVLTLINRHLEPYRGFHTFMRALPAIQRARPQAHTLILGADGSGYGPAPKHAAHWRDALLAELAGQLDLGRIHFLGLLPYEDYLRVLQVSRAHAYLTYPFVLSWSMLEAMAAGCTLLASATPPVLEVVRDGKNGLLFDFLDHGRLAELAVEVLAAPERYRHLGENARQTVIKRYDLASVTLPAQLAFAQRLLDLA